MNTNYKNMRGFTLIELLAVIVVLAIVMLIAVQAILPQMEKARRQVLALEASTAIESAQSYFMSTSLTGGAGLPATEGATNCVTLADLTSGGYFQAKNGNYTGKVVVTKKGNIYLYSVYIQKDNKWMIVNNDATTESTTNGAGNNGTTNTDINENAVGDFKTETWSTAKGDSCS